MDLELDEFALDGVLVGLSRYPTTLDIGRCYRWQRAARYVLEKFTLVGKFLDLHEQLQVVRANNFIRVLFFRKFFDTTYKLMRSYRDKLPSPTLEIVAKEARFGEDPSAKSEGLTALFALGDKHVNTSC